MEAYGASDLPIDRLFVDRNTEATGIDFRAAAKAPAPEQVAAWTAPGATGRKRGFAFAAPLAPGKTDAARAFAREAYQTRRAELTASRLGQGLVREEVFLNQTPAGDVVVVYVEGDDPVEGNRRFAASSAPYDRWFKDRCREIFPPFVDFDQPVPANEEVFSWVAG
jgi:hypothetical protein